LAGFSNLAKDALFVERFSAATWKRDVEAERCGGRCFRLLLTSLLRALLTVEHVCARDFVLAGTHERELDLILDVFDVKGARCRRTAKKRGNDLRGEIFDNVAAAVGGSSAAAFDSNEGLGDGDGDFRGIKR